jgi:hypothetical protein
VKGQPSRNSRAGAAGRAQRLCGEPTVEFTALPDTRGRPSWDALREVRATATTEVEMKRPGRRTLLETGGYVAGVILIAFGIAAIVLGITGRSTVTDSIKQEYIVGGDDMNPTAIAAAAQEAGLPAEIELPDCDVAGEPISNGSEARCFAQYMRIHALEASGGLTYAQLPRFATEDGQGTNDPAQALIGENGQPVSNPVRETWITETALATALNTSYMAERLAFFGIVVGIALLLAGVGFLVLAAAVFHRRRSEGPGPGVPPSDDEKREPVETT